MDENSEKLLHFSLGIELGILQLCIVLNVNIMMNRDPSSGL